jgi:hypothetical protein
MMAGFNVLSWKFGTTDARSNGAAVSFSAHAARQEENHD